MYILECELEVPASIEETFAVFEDPYNLAKITPPWLGFKIVTQGLNMRKGAEIDYSIRWLGLPLKWKTEITAYEPPEMFVDEARTSPYKIWVHRHTFRSTATGTMVRDRVEYDLPFGPLGGIAHRLIVAPQLREIFEYRQKAIAGLLGRSALHMYPPVIRKAPG